MCNQKITILELGFISLKVAGLISSVQNATLWQQLVRFNNKSKGDILPDPYWEEWGGENIPTKEVRYLISIPSSSSTPNQMVSGDHISKPSSHTVLLMNARSVQNKTALTDDVILDEGADLACITETWVGEEGGVPLS